ncbi:putative nuclease HARBI1 [Ruditapes philippinarum]|uniref:putative nuclease HARBI1 n=1 Tax=Ruditapes philippinarum TaxID=129788 RepID=UPI00295ACE8A|nr:putative nuclease HARBI1 [Ruditapes philippinarum]
MDILVEQERVRRYFVRQRQNIIVYLAALYDEGQFSGGRRRRSIWVKPWLQRRVFYGQYDTLMMELMRESRGDFKTYLRMEPEMFREILTRVAPRITKNKQRRPPLEAGLKVAITMRFLATGNSYHSLAFDFRVAHNTISLFVPEVCEAIVAEFKDEVICTPSTPDEWIEVANKFRRRWDFHHTCGALDGKHIAIKKPKQSGSQFYNYKGFFSIVLLGLVDADYKFLWANIGANGSSSDCGVFNRSSLEPALREGTLGLPPPEPLPFDDRNTPYFLVGDDAFPLRSYLIKPFPHRFLDHDERIFNYRCSRARRVVENAFGILAARFRCLLTTMQTTPRNAKRITKACLILHNLMRDRYPSLQNEDLDHDDGQGDVVPGAWRNVGVLDDVNDVARGPRGTREGKQLRVYLKHYYCSDVGRVPWQEAAINMPLR